MNEHVEELISALIDDEATGEQRMLVEEHMKHCRTCKQIFDDVYLLKHETFAVYDAIPIPATIHQQVMSLIVPEKSKKSWTWWLSISMVCLFLLLIILSPIGVFGIRITSSVFTLFYAVFQVLPIVLQAVPFLIKGISLFAGILLLLSLWSLRRLLIVKEIG